MAAWWGGLTDSISSMAKDVLTEGTEEVDDHATALQLEQKKTNELTSQNTAIRAENESLRSQLTEINDSLQSSEIQINSVNSEYKSLLQDKEEEVKGLKKTIEELNESNKSLVLSAPGPGATERSHYSHFNQPHSNGGSGLSLDTYGDEIGDDIGDMLSNQSEINRLNSELERVRAECLHWKRESKRASTPQTQDTASVTATARQQKIEEEKSALQQQTQDLESRLSVQSEKYQQELSTLDQLHNEKLAGVKKAYTQQIEELHSEIEELQSSTEHQQHGGTTDNSEQDRLQDKNDRLHKRVEELEEEEKRISDSLSETEEQLRIASLTIEGHDGKLREEQEKFKVQLKQHDARKMDTENSNLSSDLQATQAELQSLKSELNATKQQLQSTQNDLEKTKSQLGNADGNESEVRQLRAELDELREDNSSLNQSITDLDQEHELIVSQLILQRDELKLKNQNLPSQGGVSATADSSAGQTDATGREQELKSKLEKASVALNELHMTKADTEKELTNSKAKIKLLAEKYKELNRQHKETESELQSVKVQLSASTEVTTPAAEVKVDTAENEEKIKQMGEEKRELERELADAHDDMVAVKKALATQQDLVESHSKVGEENSQSKEKINQLEQQLAQSQVTNDDKLSQSEVRIQNLEGELNQSQMRIDEMTDKLNQSQMEEADNLSTMQQSLDASNEMISTMKAKLTERNSECNELTTSLSQKEQLCSLLTTELQQVKGQLQIREGQMDDLENVHSIQKAQLKSETEKVTQLQTEVDKITDSASRLQEELDEKIEKNQRLSAEIKEKARQTAENSDGETANHQMEVAQLREEIERLKSALSEGEAMEKSAEKQTEVVENMEQTAVLLQTSDPTDERSPRDRADSELTDTQTDPQIDQSDDDQLEDSPRDESTASSTEAQELRLQLTELRELLAQKVLLINELQGDQDGTDSDANDSFIMVDRKMSTLSDSETPPSDQSPPSRVDKIELELKQTQTDLETSKQHSDDLSQANQKLETDLKNLISERDKLTAAQEQSQKTLTDLKKRLQQSAADVAKLEHQLDTTNAQLDNKLAEATLLTETLNGAKMESESLQRSVDSLNVQLDEQRQTGSKSQTDLEQVLSTVRQQLLESEDQVARHLNESQKLKSIVDDLETRNSDLTNNLSDSKQLCSSQEEKLVLAKENLQTASNEIEAKCSEIETLNLQLESKQNQEASSEKELEASSAQVTELKSELESVHAQNKQLENDLQQAQTELEKNKVTESDDVKRLQGELSTLQNDMSRFESDKAALEKDLVELVEVRATSESLTSELKALENALVEKDDKIQEMTDSVSQSETDLADMEDQLERLEEALNMKTTELEQVKTRERGREETLHLTTGASQAPSSMSAGGSGESAAEEGMTDELKAMRLELQEKDKVIVELRNTNSSLKNTLSVYGDLHSLENQVRSLKVENDQMCSVIGEKSREISTLKKQVHSLMEANTSRDNRTSEQDDMSKQTIRKLTNLIKDKDMEVEALKSKNSSLLSILQSQPSGDSGSVTSAGQPDEVVAILEEKSALEQQLSVYKSEREQLVLMVQTKHNEALSWHTEAVRLQQLVQQQATSGTEADDVQQSSTAEGQSSSSHSQQSLSVSTDEVEKLRCDYTDKKQQLIEAQHQISQYKQRCEEMTNQLSSMSSADTVPSAIYDKLSQEMDSLKSRLERQKEALLEKDRLYEEIQLRLSSESETGALQKSECNTLRKQIENLTFELSDTRSALDDSKDSYDKHRLESSHHDQTIASLRQTEVQLQNSLRDKEREIAQLTSQVNSAGQSDDEEKSLLRQTIQSLTGERDQASLAAQQNYRACQELQTELGTSRESEAKLQREVERLRSHLVSIEEGYTGDLLQSEEREKELRNRLAVAEEKAASTSTAVQHASLEASRQIGSLEDELNSVMTERDDLIIQLTTSQDQVQQQEQQLSNLQLVLEQFQAEKDSMHQAEVSRYKEALNLHKAQISDLSNRLDSTQSQLQDQTEALEAAQRLTEQVERKEEAITALREEVTMRENRLLEAEQQVRKLSSGNESKVEKMLMKNLIINYYGAPSGKKSEVLQLIARVLTFSEEDLIKVGLSGPSHGWIGGMWSRIAHPPTSPKKSEFDKSFSELFVKFLEAESAPKPTPVPLPVDRMVQEEKDKAELHHRAAFNPFIGTTAASRGGGSGGGANTGNHPLIIPKSTTGQLPLRNSSPLFPPANQLITTPVNTAVSTTTPVSISDSPANLLVAPAARNTTPTTLTTGNTNSQANLLVAPAVRHNTPNSAANPLISNLSNPASAGLTSLAGNIGSSKFIPISSAGPYS